MSRFTYQGEAEPPYEDESRCPKTLTKTRHIDDVLYVAGRGPVPSDIMFVTTAVEKEEAAEFHITTAGFKMKQHAEYLKGPSGVIKDVAMRAGLDLHDFYYTALVKWLLPTQTRAKPLMTQLRWGLPVLMDEIKRVQPKIIVCLGKQAFDMLSDVKLSFKDAHGGWFWSEKANALLYLTHAPYRLVLSPELYETFRVDFMEIQRKRKEIEHGHDGSLPINARVITKASELRHWVKARLANKDYLHSVDCEWHGQTFVDMQLRSLQSAWNETDAVYMRFRDEHNRWAFEFDQGEQEAPTMEEFLAAEQDRAEKAENSTGDGGELELWEQANRKEMPKNPADDEAFIQRVSEIIDKSHVRDEADQAAIMQRERERPLYTMVGEILAPLFSHEDTRFLAHHGSADAPVMHHWLGVNVYKRFIFDTEFAQQVVDETSELGLERGIAMKYTTLGRYNTDLILWKKENKALCRGGYGLVPDRILIPYGVKDVLAPMRAYPIIVRQLEAQGLKDYYDTIVNPFVTDVFTRFNLDGLPMDIERMDDLRELMNYVNHELEEEFRKKITLRARGMMMGWVIGAHGLEKAVEARQIADQALAGDFDGAWKRWKNLAPPGQILRYQSMLEHLVDCPGFKRTSQIHMRRWLFDVEGLTPIKSTNQKAKGLPSMAWAKVLELPKEKQRDYTPAADKQTLQILQQELPILDQVQDLSVIGTICRSFLPEPKFYTDEDGVEVMDEAGLHQWIATDGRLHPNMSCTETSRPRSWKPNTLNLSAYVNERILNSVERIVSERAEAGTLPDNLKKWVGKPPPSMRSCIKAPEGYVLTEFDWRSAEMFGLAYISGDKVLMDLLENPDPEWGMLDDDEGTPVRVCFLPTEKTGIPAAKQNPAFIMALWKNGKKIRDVDPSELKRDSEGQIVHASFDIHWSLAERAYTDCREMMNKKVEREASEDAK